MKCYIDRFKSKYDLDNICKELLSFLSDEFLMNIVEESNVLRLKCNLFKKTDIIKLPRKKVENGIVALYKTNEDLNRKISCQWNLKLKSTKEKLKDLEYEEAKKILDKKEKAESLFKYATVFWSKNEEKFNLLGDKAYEIYLSQKNTRKIIKRGQVKMNNILDTSLGELLEVFNNEKLDKQQQLEESIKQNSEEIKKLSQQMKIIIEFNKEIKNMLNSITGAVKTLEKETNNHQSKISDKLYLIDEEINEISKEIKETNETKEKSEQAYKKELKTINSNIKGVADSFKNQNKMLEKFDELKEDIRKELSDVTKEINNFKFDNNKAIEEKVSYNKEKELNETQVDKVKKINVLEKKEDNLGDTTLDSLVNELLKDK